MTGLPRSKRAPTTGCSKCSKKRCMHLQRVYAKLPRVEREALRAIALVGDRTRVGAIPWQGNDAVLRASVSRLVERGQRYRPSERGEVAFSLPLYSDYLRRVGEDL
jgi:hypothetical protein